MQQVHLRINDAATGQPTPVRLRVTDAAGNYYAPFGRWTQFATRPNQDVGGNVLVDGKAWAYIDGSCEILLPTGRALHLSATKGPEYRPLEADVSLQAGKLSMRFQIERWANACRDGWHSGDTRVHSLPPHAALLEARAEDVGIVHLLARSTHTNDASGQDHWAIPNLLAFSGQVPCLQAPGHVVAVNTENFHRQLGSLGLLHCHRIVYPLTFGGSAGLEDWTLEDWCGQCHRKKGLVVWTRTDHGSSEFAWGEPLVDLLLGAVDAYEISNASGPSLRTWYDLLNVGIRVPLVGASGKEANATVLGALRTYVHVPAPEEATLATWIEGIRAGRTFVSSGAMLDFTVNGQPPGSIVHVSRGAVQVRAQAKSLGAIAELILLQNGIEVAKSIGAGQPAEATLEVEVRVEHGCWLAAVSRGDRFAHTSAVYVDVAGRPLPVDQGAAARFLGEIDRMIVWCRTKARCPTPQARERLLGPFLRARENLIQK
jgi:hypothetical protein